MFLVCAKRCSECLFSKNKIVNDASRVRHIQICVTEDRHFVCHKASLADHGREVTCRGFFDEKPGIGQMVRIAGRLGAIRFVDPVTLEEPG